MTDNEAQILHILAQALGVAPAGTAECRAVVAGESPSPFDDDTEFGGHHMGDATTYQSALIAALDDDVISEDEWAMLDHLRRIIGLQEDRHALIEESIRAMSEVDEEGLAASNDLSATSRCAPFESHFCSLNLRSRRWNRGNH